MSLRQFIRDNREDIDHCIKKRFPGCRIDNAERRLWILNDESLYHWARSEGVRI